jgi:hypothetical protein
VVVLLYEETDRKLGYMLDLQYRLIEAGHAASLAPKTLRSLGMDAERVARFVNETGADAWVVFGGPREVLEWFADQPVPAFALFGRRRTVRMAGTGPDKVPILLEVVRRLVALGHRKIVLLVREEQRKPQPGLLARTFLDELEVCGIPTSSYNLPDWEDSPEGFRHCLDSLFQVTSPTALIIDETFLFTVAQQHLARHGILAPEHISLVCADPDPTFAWFHPTISHIRWDSRPVVRRIVRWEGPAPDDDADGVRVGRDDRAGEGVVECGMLPVVCDALPQTVKKTAVLWLEKPLLGLDSLWDDYHVEAGE